MPPPTPSGVDLTMDDQQQGLPRTVVGTTPPPPAAPVTSPPQPRTVPPALPRLVTSNETRVVDESADIAAARQTDGGRPLMIVAACFLIGALAMALIAYKAGLIGAHPGTARVPPAATVAAMAEVTPVVADPERATSAAGTSAIPPLVTGKPQGSAGVGATRASIDVSSAKPGVGQPIDLVGRLQGTHTKVDGAHFHISGPGLTAGTDVTAVDDGAGSYRASFAFMQPGRFEVDFAVRADGTQARAVRMIVAGDPRASQPAPPTDTSVAAPAGPPATAPASAPSAKWM